MRLDLILHLENTVRRRAKFLILEKRSANLLFSSLLNGFNLRKRSADLISSINTITIYFGVFVYITVKHLCLDFF